MSVNMYTSVKKQSGGPKIILGKCFQNFPPQIKIKLIKYCIKPINRSQISDSKAPDLAKTNTFANIVKSNSCDQKTKFCDQQ